MGATVGAGAAGQSRAERTTPHATPARTFQDAEQGKAGGADGESPGPLSPEETSGHQQQTPADPQAPQASGVTADSCGTPCGPSGELGKDLQGASQGCCPGQGSGLHQPSQSESWGLS